MAKKFCSINRIRIRHNYNHRPTIVIIVMVASSSSFSSSSSSVLLAMTSTTSCNKQHINQNKRRLNLLSLDNTDKRSPFLVKIRIDIHTFSMFTCFTGKLLRESLGSGLWREIKICFVNMSIFFLDSKKHKRTQLGRKFIIFHEKKFFFLLK